MSNAKSKADVQKQLDETQKELERVTAERDTLTAKLEEAAGALQELARRHNRLNAENVGLAKTLRSLADGIDAS